uniref:Bm930 n=1 Tax=Brugia malayi TaxID=6279 RepID=A0A1I9G5F7_BRUMA|nr:Bm930 [Brugia malayi]
MSTHIHTCTHIHTHTHTHTHAHTHTQTRTRTGNDARPRNDDANKKAFNSELCKEAGRFDVNGANSKFQNLLK